MCIRDRAKGEDGKYHNMFRGTDLGMGGYVYAEPGMYTNVALLDVASLHPHSAVAMNYFGEYTKHFNDLMDVRIYVKHGEYEKAKGLFGGKLAKYLDDPQQAKALAQALKIAINSVYGLTSASSVSYTHLLFIFMRYHDNAQPQEWTNYYGSVYRCNHPVYRVCTLYKEHSKGLCLSLIHI